MDEQNAFRSTETEPGDELKHRCLRALYVEDSPRDAKLYSKQLEKAGFEVEADIVTTLDDFVRALRSTCYDVILADQGLPGWSGTAALEALQREGMEIPFIFVSGSVVDEVAVECVKRGATDYVLKDRLARLSHAVERALSEKAAREERRKAERSRDLLASLVESSDEAIIAMTLDGAILTWNRGAAGIYGYTVEEIEGKPLSLLFAPNRAEELYSALLTLQRGESTARYESLGVKKDGSVIDVAVTISSIRPQSDDLAGASAIIRDITSYKRLQAELFFAQKMEAVGRLAAGVAHDFNNLLTVVTGYSSLTLAKLNERDPLFSGIEQVRKAGERASALTQQLLAFSRKQLLQPQVIDLNDRVRDMDRMLRRLIGEDINLVTVLEPSLGKIKADPGQMEQVIMNLAVNARDAMPTGGKLTIETSNVDLEETLTRRHITIRPGAYVLLAITDSGSGMDAETEARIFEPFFTTKGEGGTGLGLSTVYGIVEQSGGAVLVYSEISHGTSFKIYLPTVDDVTIKVQAAPSQGAPRGSETVLVVEDEDAVRSLVCEILEEQGYNVLNARNGAEALAACHQRAGIIDLVITDVVMPSMSGSELATRLRPLHPQLKLIFMSGYTDNAIIHHGVLSADMAFLNKPFTPQMLARKVREVLDSGSVVRLEGR